MELFNKLQINLDGEFFNKLFTLETLEEAAPFFVITTIVSNLAGMNFFGALFYGALVSGLTHVSRQFALINIASTDEWGEKDAIISVCARYAAVWAVSYIVMGLTGLLLSPFASVVLFGFSSYLVSYVADEDNAGVIFRYVMTPFLTPGRGHTLGRDVDFDKEFGGEYSKPPYGK